MSESIADSCMVAVPECPAPPPPCATNNNPTPLTRSDVKQEISEHYENIWKGVENAHNLKTKVTEANFNENQNQVESQCPTSNGQVFVTTRHAQNIPNFLAQINNNFAELTPKSQKVVAGHPTSSAHNGTLKTTNVIGRNYPSSLVELQKSSLHSNNNVTKLPPAMPNISNHEFISVIKSLAEKHLKQTTTQSNDSATFPVANVQSSQFSRPVSLNGTPANSENSNDCNRTSPNEDFSVVSSANMNGGPHIQLWQFLLELLGDPSKAHIISWINSTGEFKLHNSEEVARLWGMRKNKTGMNYDKLSRALRYYYHKGLIKKVLGQKFVYKFIAVPSSETNQTNSTLSPVSEPTSPSPAQVSPTPDECSSPMNLQCQKSMAKDKPNIPERLNSLPGAKRPLFPMAPKDEPLDLSTDNATSKESDIGSSNSMCDSSPSEVSPPKKAFFQTANPVSNNSMGSNQSPCLSNSNFTNDSLNPRSTSSMQVTAEAAMTSQIVSAMAEAASNFVASTSAGPTLAIPAAAASSLYPWFAAAAATSRDPTIGSNAICSPLGFPGFPLFYATPIAMAPHGGVTNGTTLGNSCCHQHQTVEGAEKVMRSMSTQTEPLRFLTPTVSGKCCECECRCNRQQENTDIIKEHNKVSSSSLINTEVEDDLAEAVIDIN